MKPSELIAVDDFCICHNIEFSFLKNLQEFGLIETVTIAKVDYIAEDQLENLERVLRLHRELEINLEGIDTIAHLLERVHELQKEVVMLRNRLGLYE